MSTSSKDIAAFVEDQYPLLVKILEVPNPSGQEEAMRELVQAELEKLGASTNVDEVGNLIGQIGDGNNAFLIGAHLDSVQPCEGIKVVREGSVVKSDGTTILSGDDGIGIFLTLVAVQYLQAKGEPVPTLDFLYTVGEEIGGVGVQALDTKDLRATAGMLLDRAAPPGTYVTAAPYKRNFRVTFHGHAVHAFEAHKGVSAIHMASAAIAQFPQGKIHEDLYANIGLIEGGESVNQVAEKAILQGEVRAFKKEDADDLLEEYQRIIASIQYRFSASGDHEPSATLEYTSRREGYHHTPDLPVIKLIEAAHQELGIESATQRTRACSDAGDLTNKGVATVNYSYAGHNVHTKEEWVDMEDVYTVAEVLVYILRSL